MILFEDKFVFCEHFILKRGKKCFLFQILKRVMRIHLTFNRAFINTSVNPFTKDPEGEINNENRQMK